MSPFWDSDSWVRVQMWTHWIPDTNKGHEVLCHGVWHGWQGLHTFFMSDFFTQSNVRLFFSRLSIFPEAPYVFREKFRTRLSHSRLRRKGVKNVENRLSSSRAFDFAQLFRKNFWKKLISQFSFFRQTAENVWRGAVWRPKVYDFFYTIKCEVICFPYFWKVWRTISREVTHDTIPRDPIYAPGHSTAKRSDAEGVRFEIADF